ncbi:MAG TPA: hypothetical protein VK179_05405 [Bacteroidales bacterium]|nr:hypothetical protein [Bacteroidales bacterium]
MKTEPYSNTEMNALIREALGSDPGYKIPSSLAEATIRKIERRLMWRELVIELSAKTGIVAGSLGILTGVLYWMGQNQLVKQIIGFGMKYKQLIVVLLASVFVIVLFDQLIFKYINRIKSNGLNTKLSRIG